MTSVSAPSGRSVAQPGAAPAFCRGGALQPGWGLDPGGFWRPVRQRNSAPAADGTEPVRRALRALNRLVRWAWARGTRALCVAGWSPSSPGPQGELRTIACHPRVFECLFWDLPSGAVAFRPAPVRSGRRRRVLATATEEVDRPGVRAAHVEARRAGHRRRSADLPGLPAAGPVVPRPLGVAPVIASVYGVRPPPRPVDQLPGGLAFMLPAMAWGEAHRGRRLAGPGRH